MEKKDLMNEKIDEDFILSFQKFSVKKKKKKKKPQEKVETCTPIPSRDLSLFDFTRTPDAFL